MDEKLLYICEICQTVLDQRQGEAICPNCGRKLDCTDLSLLPANGSLDEEDQFVLRPGSDPADLLPLASEPALEISMPQANGQIARGS